MPENWQQFEVRCISAKCLFTFQCFSFAAMQACSSSSSSCIQILICTKRYETFIEFTQLNYIHISPFFFFWKKVRLILFFQNKWKNWSQKGKENKMLKMKIGTKRNRVQFCYFHECEGEKKYASFDFTDCVISRKYN